MATHWVKVVKPLSRYSLEGAYKNYQPGDWFECKNQELAVLVAAGNVVPVNPQAVAKAFDLGDCGVVITGKNVTANTAYIHKALPDLEVTAGDGLVFPRTLLWDGKAGLRLDLVPIGFYRLERGWQVAAPLWAYRKLARDIGSEADRARTREVIHDLRVPVYECGLLYVLRCPETETLMTAWRDERNDGGDNRLAFMRAFYRVKPIMNALPQTWIK
jgi:hypothetical protein